MKCLIRGGEAFICVQVGVAQSLVWLVFFSVLTIKISFKNIVNIVLKEINKLSLHSKIS